MNQTKFESLDAALANVPKEVQPTRDLWPGIAAQLATERKSTQTGGITELGRVRDERNQRTERIPRLQWLPALAASVGVVGLSVALGWAVLGGRNSAPLTAQSTAQAVARSVRVNFGPPDDAHYRAARAALEETYNSRLKLLAPATRARVEADLEVIRRANEDLRSALAHDPASPLLLQLLHSTSQQEIDLYTSVAQSTEPLLTSRRT